MEEISGWVFDLSKPVLLLHPNEKFWEATLDGRTLSFRVGKIENDVERSTEEADKSYPSYGAAKNSAVSKIQEKLTKGYYLSLIHI